MFLQFLFSLISKSLASIWNIVLHFFRTSHICSSLLKSTCYWESKSFEWGCDLFWFSLNEVILKHYQEHSIPCPKLSLSLVLLACFIVHALKTFGLLLLFIKQKKQIKTNSFFSFRWYWYQYVPKKMTIKDFFITRKEHVKFQMFLVTATNF